MMTEKSCGFNRVASLLEEGREAEFFLDGENYVIMCSGGHVSVWQCADTPEEVAGVPVKGSLETALEELFADPLFSANRKRIRWSSQSVVF